MPGNNIDISKLIMAWILRGHKFITEHLYEINDFIPQRELENIAHTPNRYFNRTVVLLTVKTLNDDRTAKVLCIKTTDRHSGEETFIMIRADILHVEYIDDQSTQVLVADATLDDLEFWIR